MSDIKLFRLTAGRATELQGDASDLEKPLQTLIENSLDTLLGIRFLATEHATGKLVEQARVQIAFDAAPGATWYRSSG